MEDHRLNATWIDPPVTTQTNPNVTPMMAQFLDIKERYPTALLFYRMGDFYEMFFEDAIAAAEALDIALTKRGKHLGQDIPMCGVPVHAAETYLMSLIRKGFRVAVAEQLEDPAEAKKRGSKAVVKRDVVRLVTPGTLTEDTLLEARDNNYLAAFATVRDASAFAWCDISTGDLFVTQCPRVGLGPMLARLAVRELLVSTRLADGLREEVEEAGASLCDLSPASFDSASAAARLCDLYGVETLDAFGQFSRAEIGALGGLIGYLDLTQRGKMPALRPPVRERPGGTMEIDTATRRNLELTRSLAGGRDDTLLSTIDRTVTGAGSRLLKNRISAPSTDPALIARRLDAVSFFTRDDRTRTDLRDLLRKTPDIDRALSRLSLDRGGPRDLAAIRDGLASAAQIAEALPAHDLPDLLIAPIASLRGHEDLTDVLGAALVSDPPLLARDGGFVADGYDADLDTARALRDEGRGVIARMQQDYADLAAVTALKIKHNNVLGYFIETPATHAKKMLAPPLSETFIHRQTTANAVRFTTVDLSTLETRILNARSQAVDLELSVFATLFSAVMDASLAISDAARALAEIDHLCALADLAEERNWTRPTVDASRRFDVTSGRHPVVEASLRSTGTDQFVPNDAHLSADGEDARPIWLITGPNMAGKSTFLRQNALIAILAQAGSFVPAADAHIGVVDQLFSRVGAADDLARGRSTFMVEMVETAAILNQAGPQALVILDEIGRGTATYDGLSIAWAALEYLHDVNRCRGLFATHYHELTGLTEKLSGLRNATVAVREWEGEVIFLHQVRDGAADRSYGVQVAKLAGLPGPVVARAREVLDALERGAHAGAAKTSTLIDDLPLFQAHVAPAPEPAGADTPVLDRLAEVHPDTLTPKDALDLIYELKGLTKDG